MKKFIKYSFEGEDAYGILEGEVIKKLQNSIFDETLLLDGAIILADDAEIIQPFYPTKVIALGHNYKDLVGPKDSYPEPIIFFKAPSAVIGNNDSIILKENVKTWIEVELAIVIKKECRNVSPDEAASHILGYTVANDVTMQNVEGRDHHLARSKGLDTFCPINYVITADIETSGLAMTSRINGGLTQNSNTSNRILNDFEAVSFVSKFFTLFPGDIILTGTPANAENSIVKGGELVELEIEYLGKLVNNVKSDF